MDTRTAEIIRELAGVKCRCGEPKVPKQTFCRFCYGKLPRKLQRELYRMVGEGYEEAYAASCTVLDERKAIDDAKIRRLKVGI